MPRNAVLSEYFALQNYSHAWVKKSEKCFGVFSVYQCTTCEAVRREREKLFLHFCRIPGH